MLTWKRWRIQLLLWEGFWNQFEIGMETWNWIPRTSTATHTTKQVQGSKERETGKWCKSDISLSRGCLVSKRKIQMWNYHVILLFLCAALQQRSAAYQPLCDRFNVIIHLSSRTDAEVNNEAKNVPVLTLETPVVWEIVQFVALFKPRSYFTPPQHAVSLHAKGLADTLPVNVARRIFLSMIGKDRSDTDNISLIKNYLRTTMTHERLCSVPLGCWEQRLQDDAVWWVSQRFRRC